MTIIRKRGHIVFECDECGEQYDSQTDDFHDALADAKSDGFEARQVRGEWQHVCGDCK